MSIDLSYNCFNTLTKQCRILGIVSVHLNLSLQCGDLTQISCGHLLPIHRISKFSVVSKTMTKAQALYFLGGTVTSGLFDFKEDGITTSSDAVFASVVYIHPSSSSLINSKKSLDINLAAYIFICLLQASFSF